MADPQLLAMFPNLNKKDINDELMRCGGKVEAAIDKLLEKATCATSPAVGSPVTSQEASMQDFRSSPHAKRSLTRGDVRDVSHTSPFPFGQNEFLQMNGSTDQCVQVQNGSGQCALPAASRDQFKREGMLVILRGLPGSGKSTLAKELAGSSGVICSTDEYFKVDGRYVFDPSKLEHYHEQNRLCAQKALEAGISPVIIDNTNTTINEMIPYVKLGQQYKYKVQLKEPDTEWKFDVDQLARRNSHGVSIQKLQKMLQRYKHHVTVEDVLRETGRPSFVDSHHSSSTSLHEQVSESSHRSHAVQSEQEADALGKCSEVVQSLPLSKDGDWLKSKSKELSEEKLTRETQPTDTQQELCHEYSHCVSLHLNCQPNGGAGMEGYKLTGSPSQCLADTHQKRVDMHLPLHENEDTPSQVHSTDSGLVSDLAPLSCSQLLLSTNPYGCSPERSEAAVLHMLTSPDMFNTLPLTSEDAPPTDVDVSSDLMFLQEMSHLGLPCLMSLYAKCNFDLEKTVDTVLAYGNSGSDDGMNLISDADSSHAQQLVFNPGIQIEGSVVTDNGGDMNCSEDTNLSLTLSRSLAIQLHKLFGRTGEPLCEGDENMLTLLSEKTAHCLYMDWIDTQKARKEAQLAEVRIQTMQKDAELAQRLQHEDDSSGEYRQEQGTNKSTCSSKDYKQALLVHNQQLLNHGSVHSSVEQDEKLTASAQVRESCEMLPAFKVQACHLYEQFPMLDKGSIDLELVRNRFDFKNTLASLKSQMPDTSPTTEPPQKQQPSKSKSSVVERMLAINTYQINNYDQCVSYNDIRAEAAIQAKLRAEAFKKSAQARRMRDHAKASHFLDEGHLCTKRMKEANQRAADLLIKIQQRPHTLDLHGLYVEEAIRALEKRLKIVHKGDHLIVITGRGTHSTNGTAKLKPVVVSYLRNHHYHYSELDAGTLQVFVY